MTAGASHSSIKRTFDRRKTAPPPTLARRRAILGPVTDAAFAEPFTESPLVPEGALAAYNGLNPNGVWKLIVRDDLPTNVGELESWDLEVRTFDRLADLAVNQTTVAQYAPRASTLVYGDPVTNEGPCRRPTSC